MLPQYTEHFKNNRNSIIAKIFGIFTIKSVDFREVHVMLMENTVQLKNEINLKNIFDLKGSTVDRTTKVENMKPSTTLKDNNFINYCEFYGNQCKSFINFTKRDVLKL